MASLNNVPKEILDSIRESLQDRRVKLSIKRMVNYESRKDKLENRVLAFSTYRLFIFTAKSPKDTKVESQFHYLDIESIESKRPNHLVISTTNKSYTFTTLESDSDEVDHMITHIATSLKTIFPAFPIERLIKKIEVQPSDRLKVMYELMKNIEQKEVGPCGGFTLMYTCMCDYHCLTFRDEVAWDVDTIYLSQDSRELCLRDFDHLRERDLIPIVSALIHNTWFTALNANNVKLTNDVCTEVLRVMTKNAVIEALLLSNTGISTDFIKKLSTTSLTGTQLQKLDLSGNMIDDLGAEHIFGSLSSRGRPFTYLDMSRTRITSKGLNKMAECMNRSPHVFSSLQTLKLSGLTSGNRIEDLQSLYTFLASPNMISYLDLSGTDIELDKLMAPLQRGCSQNIVTLKLSKTTYSNKRSKEVVIQTSFKQFFASVYALKYLDLSCCKLPAEAVKDLLLGICSNRNLQDVHLDISGIDLTSQGAQYLQNCLKQTVTSLNISNIGFSDQDLMSVLNSIGQYKVIKHLSIGRVFNNIKPKNLKHVMEELVQVLQDEDSVIESLSLADSRLKDSMNLIINALGGNTSLTEIDLSGNLMGDLGARMLSKALQINNKLKTIFWDKNSTGCQGFEDVAEALEKNYTLKKMPMPVYDASVALQRQPEKTEQALQTIERLLQRNHSPQKYSSDQAYRLQQGFLISSTQQTVDRLVVQSQDTINALSAMNAVDEYSDDVETAKAVIEDADNSKTLLPRLHDIAIQSQNNNSPVSEKLKEISRDLKIVLENQMKKTVQDMLNSVDSQCKALMKDKLFLSDLQSGCTEKSMLPKDFTSNILDGVDTDIFNTLSELNLAVAAHVSDRVIDEVIERLSHSHKTLTNHLNECKKGAGRRSQVTKSQKMEDNDSNIRNKENDGNTQDSPRVKEKRKSMHARKIRPQSVIDRDHVKLALDADRNRPITVPQSAKSGSRSPKNKSPKPPRSKDRKKSADKAALVTPKMGDLDSSPSRSPICSPRSITPLPIIQVTDLDDLDPIYDNVMPDSRYMRNIHDGLDSSPEPVRSTPKKSSTPEPEIEIDTVPELPTQNLTHITKNRARRAKNVRPTTRQSSSPATKVAIDNGEVDEHVEDFFSKASSQPSVNVTEKKDDTPTKTPSTKSTPESKKKLGGIFNFGHKEKDKTKDSKKSGGLFSKLTNKPSPSPKKGSRISDVVEEPDDTSSLNSSLTRSVTENSSLRGSFDKKSTKSSDSSSPKITRSASSLSEKKDKISEKSDSLERKANDTVEKTPIVKTPDTKSTKIEDSKKDSQIEEKTEKPDIQEEEIPKVEKEEKTKSQNEEKSEESVDDNKVEKSTGEDLTEDKPKVEKDVIEEEKKPLKPPLSKRSFNKADVVKDENIDQVKESGDKVTENEKKEESEDKTETKTKADDEVNEEDAEKEKDKEETVKRPFKPPGGIGGIGFGGNLLAEMKSKQEKRKSQMPPKPLPETTDRPNSENEEKKFPFGTRNLKPVNKPVPSKETESDTNNSGVPVKPADNKISGSVKLTGSQSDNKSAEPVDKTSEPVEKKTDKVVEDKKNNGSVKGESAPLQKTNSGKSDTSEKPAVVPRPGGNRPLRPAKPRPPPPGSKPMPAPRKSTSGDGDVNVSEPNKAGNKEDKTVESGIVYDSATLKMSVKDKISKFGKSGVQNEAGQGKSLSQYTKKEPLEKPAVAEKGKSSSLPRDAGLIEADKSTQQTKDNSNEKNEENSEAGGILDKKSSTENVDMTDSGIVYDDDSLKTNKEINETSDNDKSASLPRNANLKDGKDESPVAPKRPKSMFAVLESRPDLKKHSTEVSDIPEEENVTKADNSETNDGEKSPTEEVILV
ncbi:barbed-end actin filament uncapping [Mactra antiquata]